MSMMGLRLLARGTRENVTDARGPGIQQLSVFKEEKCHACGKVGHISRACRSKAKYDQGSKRLAERHKRDKRQNTSHRSHKVQENQDESESNSSEDETFSLSCMTFRLGRMSEVHLRKVDPYTVGVELNEKKKSSWK